MYELVTNTIQSITNDALDYLEVANNGTEVLYRSEDKKKSGTRTYLRL